MQQWRLIPDIQIHWKQWQTAEDCIIFNADSGQTHLLSYLSILTMKLLQERAFNCDELSAYLAKEFDSPVPTQEIQLYVINMLDQMQALGLIESTTPPLCESL